VIEDPYLGLGEVHDADTMWCDDCGSHHSGDCAEVCPSCGAPDDGTCARCPECHEVLAEGSAHEIDQEDAAFEVAAATDRYPDIAFTQSDMEDY